jgi:type II secretory pathway pseudopilin PulG
VDWVKCITNRLLRAAKREAGFTLMETLFAIVIFGTVSTALIGVLTSATAADSHSRQKTIALELAQQQIEYIRQLNYRDVGLVDGNPGGVVQETQSKKVIGLWYTLTTSIDFVDDPAPGSYVSSANYKRIQVDVTRKSDGTELATARTYVSSATPLETGGLNNGLINVTAEDFLTHALLGNVDIDLAKTWDASFLAGDYTGTDSTSPLYGVATFEGLEPTPTDPLGYYDITAALTGYTTLAADLPPTDPTASQSAGHIALAKSGTSNTTIYLYKPCGITVRVIDGSNAPNLYTGSTTVTISSAKLGVSQQFMTTTGIVTRNQGDTLDGELIAPGSDYEVDVATTTPYTRHGVSTGLTVPTNYPTDLSSSFDVTLADYVPPQVATVTVTVRKGSTTKNGCTSTPLGNIQAGATVKLALSSNPTNPTFTTITNSSGIATFTGVPYDTYDISSTYKVNSYTTYKGTTAGQVISSPTASACVSVF